MSISPLDHALTAIGRAIVDSKETHSLLNNFRNNIRHQRGTASSAAAYRLSRHFDIEHRTSDRAVAELQSMSGLTSSTAMKVAKEWLRFVRKKSAFNQLWLVMHLTELTSAEIRHAIAEKERLEGFELAT